jgi:D-amino-acid dehydrogenase
VSKHVLIVGGGIVGLSTAWYCARKGYRVTLVERGGPDRSGCSFVNAGMLVPSHIVPLASPGMVRLGLRWMWNPESPFYLKPRLDPDLLSWGWRFNRAATQSHVERAAPVLRDLHLASRDCYREWAALWNNAFDLVERGMLMLCNTAHGLDEEAKAAEYARRLGMQAEVLTAAEAAEREPALRMEIEGAVYFPVDSQVTPMRVMSVLADEVERAGVDVSCHTVVEGWRRAGARIESLRVRGGEEISADEYVVCAGFWSQAAVRELGVNIPMQAGKGYSMTLDKPAALPRICAILSEARVAVTPMEGSLRFAGTMELGGDEETIDGARVRGMVKSIAAYYPDITQAQLQHATVRTGLRPCSPDGLPYVGRVSRYANLSVATGHAMMGMSLGPITGKVIAEMLAGETPSCDVAALSPDRYA